MIHRLSSTEKSKRKYCCSDMDDFGFYLLKKRANLRLFCGERFAEEEVAPERNALHGASVRRFREGVSVLLESAY